MKPRKLESIEVVGFLVSPGDEKIEDSAGNLLVCTEHARRSLLTAKKRDSNLLAMD